MSISIFTILNDLYIYLHATSSADVVWFTDAELTILCNDHFRHLTQNTGLNVQRDDTTIELVDGSSLYDLPADYLSGLEFAFNGLPLRPGSTYELERYDPTLTQPSTPQFPMKWWYTDKEGVGVVGFFPVPGVNEEGLNVEVIFHEVICNIDVAHTVTTIPLPAVFGDWAEFQVAADCYGIESPLRAVDIAQGMMGMATLYFDVFQKYWGTAQ